MNTKKLISILLSLALVVSMVALVGAVASADSASDWENMVWEDDTVAVIWRGGNDADRYDEANWEQFDSLFPEPIYVAATGNWNVPSHTNAGWTRTGAIMEAATDDVVIMVDDEHIVYESAANMPSITTFVNNITLDTAGNQIQATMRGSQRSILFNVGAHTFTIRNTVDGLGEELAPMAGDNTAQIGGQNNWFHNVNTGHAVGGCVRHDGLTFSMGSGGVLNISNIRSVDLEVTDTNSSSIVLNSGATLNMEGSITQGRHGTRQTGSATYNVYNSLFIGDRAVFHTFAGDATGTVEDSLIHSTNTRALYTVRGGTSFENALIFINTRIQDQNGDQPVMTINDGVVRMYGGRVGRGNNPDRTVQVNGTSRLYADGTAFDGARNNAATRVINIAATATVTLSNATLRASTDGENPARASNRNLYSHNVGTEEDPVWVSSIAPGMAVFGSSTGVVPVASEDTILPRDYDPLAINARSVRVAPCEHWGYEDANNCGICATVLRACDCDDSATVWDVTTPPTCTTPGVETRTGVCEAHGADVTRPIDIDPDAHSFTVVKYDTEYTGEHWVVCYHCDAEQPGSRADHIFTNFVSGGDGTQTAVCDFNGCNATHTVNVARLDVTIDGAVVDTVDQGSSFTFPASAATGFIAYTDGDGGFFDAGATITVNQALTFTTVALEVTMLRGAAMRLGNPTGLRFLTSVDTDVVDMLRENGANVTMGTLIAPADLVGRRALTSDIEDESRMDVQFDSADWHINAELDFVGIAGSIANIQDHNAARQFIGRGYVTVEVAGITRTIYAEHYDGNVVNNTRSVGWVASRIAAEPEFELLPPDTKEVVLHYYDLWRENTSSGMH